jgi:hypothetical protein
MKVVAVIIGVVVLLCAAAIGLSVLALSQGGFQ